MDPFSAGPIRVETIQHIGNHPLDDVVVRILIDATDDVGDPSQVVIEGPLGPELMHLLHAMTVLCHEADSEWVVPTMQHPLQLIRHGTMIEVAAFPSEYSAAWLADEELHWVSFRDLLLSLSAVVEEVLGHMDRNFANDESVEILVHQWERLWQWSSRLFMFGTLGNATLIRV